ncbi:MAG TPA: FliH/SctL family protein [Geobacteraceae bacterium]|nr:FliH/SctL family protein [Geobacteraceae bacterium]
MSLSRVIKTGSSSGQSIASFCFNNFQRVPGQAVRPGHDGFMPFYDDGPPAASEEDEQAYFAEAPAVAEEEISSLIRMSEEELQDKLQEAFARGAEEEKKQADEDLAGIYSALCEAISIVSRLKERIIRESEDELLQLAFLVAKKIVRQEIKHDRRILAQLVSEALKGFPEQHDIVVSLHPEDYKVISANRDLFPEGFCNDRQVTLKADEATTLGGCIVESATGVIDARIEAQLDEIYSGLVEERERLGDSAGHGAAPVADEEPAP